jgi:hypothetical protein
MPSGDEDLERVFIGGCLIDENPAKYICIACDIPFGGPRDAELSL